MQYAKRIILALGIMFSYAQAEPVQEDLSHKTGTIRHVSSEDEFYSLITEHDVVVDFYASWCGPCKILLPILTSVAKEMNDIIFVKIDIDSFPNLSNQYKIRSIPTILLFKKSKQPCLKINQVLSKTELKNAIKRCYENS